MKLIDTFDILDGNLFAAVYDDPEYKGVNEFRRLLNQWTDRKFLTDYFIRNKENLQKPFWNEVVNGNKNSNVEIAQAIDRTIEDANEFEQKILKFGNGKIKGVDLDNIFLPLHKEIKHNRMDDEFKAYGIRQKSWLRFYAIKIENNVYFLSGGGIKLTLEMKNSEGLKIELNKLEKAYNYLTNP